MEKILFARICILIAIFFTTYDLSLTATSIPYIANHFQIASNKAIWVYNYYQVAMFAAILPATTLSYRFGYKKIFITGLVLFNLSAIAASTTHTFEILMISKFFQGIGVAALAAINTALIKVLTPPERLGKALGINIFMVALGFTLGPLSASYILSRYSFGWLFLSYVPITLLLLVLCSRFIPIINIKYKSVNLKRLCLFFSLLFLFCFAVNSLQSSFVQGFLYLVLSIIGLFLFLSTDLHHQFKILNYHIFKIQNFNLSILISFISYAAQSMFFVALPFLFTGTLHKNISEIGYLLSPWPLLGAIFAPISGTLSDKYSSALIVLIGNFFLLLISSCFMFFDISTSNVFIITIMALCGISFALFNSPNQQNILSNIPLSLSSEASGVLSLARISGQTFGSAYVGLWFFLFPIKYINSLFLSISIFLIMACILSYNRFLKQRKIIN